MIIALFPNSSKPQSYDLAKGIQNFLEDKKVTVVTEDSECEKIHAKPLSSVDLDEIDFMISMGGDGTILSLSRKYGKLKAGILGINLGHLGFMADIPITDIYPSLTDLLNKKYQIHERLMLESLSPDNKILYAGNDFVIHRAQNHSLIELSVHINGVYLNSFLADGIIIATPTGSTAYSLAAGGPILSPNLAAFVITPICAHTISNRPIVLTPENTVQIQYLSKYDPVKVWADGIEYFTLSSGKIAVIKKSAQVFRLVSLDRHDYFATLRSKLSWSGKLH
jgi:NAD+ kinase